MGYNCLFIDIGVTISRRSDYSVAFKGLLDGQLYLVDFNDNKESEEPSQAQDQPSSSIQASPPTQDEEMTQEEEDEDQDYEPPQEEDIDQGGNEDDQDKEDDQEIQDQRPPHPRVHQAIQRDHPINSILGDIHKGVTTRSRVAHFCEHYSYVSSIEPYMIEDALRDLDWVVAMQEELNNFTENEVWHLVPHPNQNVVGTKWVFCNKQDEHGVVTRNKARLIAKGYSQVKGLDFDETYALVARLLSQFVYYLLMLLTMALSYIKCTSTMPSSMALSRKRYTLSNLPALKIVSTQHMFISSQRLFMGSSKPQEHGMNA
jgi:hypothetical protein